LPETILVIEDELGVRVLMKTGLQQRGYRVLTAPDGPEGLRIATETPPDAIILDVRMPAMGGFDVLAKLVERRVPTRVIITSGHRTTVADVVHGIKLGACDYVVKPFRMEDMANSLKRVLAVEQTLNLHVSTVTPIVETLAARTIMLQSQCADLRAEVEKLRRHNYWRVLTGRIVSVLVSVGLTVGVWRLGLLREGLALVLWPLALFVVLMMPLERVQQVSAQFRKARAKMVMKE
jgi:two-component system nitrogen regulation response regulator NtrX